MNKKRIAIIGAGGLGVCLALELSQRGYEIDLYEENSLPLRKASYVNEGKIHLGHIYAMDKDFKTSAHMIRGAMNFLSNLNRWIKIEPDEVISTPFYYGIHKGSLMSPDELAGHYKRCDEYFGETQKYYKKKYLNQFEKAKTRRLSLSEMDGIANPEFIDAVFQTTEHAIDPRGVAEKLGEALVDNPSINLSIKTKINSVSKEGPGFLLNGIREGEIFSENYPEVVNCAWNGLLEIDKTMGIEPEHNWSFRYKFGNKIIAQFPESATPSLTMVQGPYGDAVNFKDRGLFISWYPIGRTGWSEEYRPPEWDSIYSPDERIDVFERSFKELAKRIPALQSLQYNLDDVQPVGGVIYAYGNQDVDTESSHLHTRFEAGVRSFGKYHTVNTGKYTLIPHLALQLAEKIDE